MSDPFPPPNPSLRWYRVVIWLMPTCLFFTTFQALDLLASKVDKPTGISLVGLIAFNLTATYLLGIFDQRLNGSKLAPDKVFPHATAFLVAQLVVVPALLIIMAVLHMLLFEM